MAKGIVISAISSKQGKTLVTMALLKKLSAQKKISPFKIGPDFIDPQYHEKILGQASVNLDLFMMNQAQVQETFARYAQGTAIVEGVMGFYDGIDNGTSTYDLAELLGIPVLLIISAEGSYSTISAVLKGMLTYRDNNTIKAIVLNRVSSESHYKMIQKQVHKDFPDISIIGWIQKDLTHLPSRHLGLDLTALNSLELDNLADEVCQHLKLPELTKIMTMNEVHPRENSFFLFFDQILETLQQKKIAVIYDKAFSFLYLDNLRYLCEIFQDLYILSAIHNDAIPQDCDVVYIPGGYVETADVYDKLKLAEQFRESLIGFAANKQKSIFAECAGLIYLGDKITDLSGNKLTMSQIMPMTFKMRPRRKRLGYYLAYDLNNHSIYKGHAFHYSEPVDMDKVKPQWSLFKPNADNAEIAAWSNTDNILATYLHTFLRSNPKIIEHYFCSSDQHQLDKFP